MKKQARLMAQIIRVIMAGVYLRIIGKEILYVQGKMTGLPNFGRANFLRIEEELKADYRHIFNPINNDKLGLNPIKDYDLLIAYDLWLIRMSHKVVTRDYMFPDDSKGCKIEADFTRSIGIPVERR